jgi:hypothetical protein
MSIINGYVKNVNTESKQPNILTQKCYEFITQNKDKIHLNYPDDPINIKNIENYANYANLQPGLQKFMLLIKKIYEQITYISKDVFIEIIDKNIDEIKEYPYKHLSSPLNKSTLYQLYKFFVFY